MEHSGHRQRMRERFMREGLGGFAPHEALELLLFYAIPQKNVNPLAHALIERFGSLSGVLEASPEQLMRVEGIGEYAAVYLSLFSQVAKRAALDRAGARVALSSRRAAEEYCVRLLSGEKRERFYAVCLNGQMEVIADALIATGSLCDVPAYPRLVADAALTHNAHAVLLCHNHPGGSLVPSQADVEATGRLAQLLGGLEVTLVDHIVVAGDEALSMVRHHLIEQTLSSTGVEARAADPQGQVRILHRLRKEKSEEP